MESATAQARLSGWLTPLLSVLPRMYKKYMCNSPSGGELHLERWSIPMIGPKLPPLTLKIVEHSRYLPVCGILVIDLNVRRNQPQCSNFALNIRTRQSHCGSCRSKGGRCRGTNGNSSYIFSAEKCTFIIKYSKAWKWCRTFSANFFDLNVRHLTCLRSFCVEHSGQLPRISKGQAIDGKPETKGRVYENWICPGLQTGAKRGITGRCASGGFSPFRKGISYFWSGQMRRQDVLRQYAHR